MLNYLAGKVAKLTKGNIRGTNFPRNRNLAHRDDLKVRFANTRIPFVELEEAKLE